MGGWLKRVITKCKLLFLSLRGGGTVASAPTVALHPSVKLALCGGGSLTLDCGVAVAQGGLLLADGGSLHLGAGASLSRGCQLVCHEKIEIGPGTMLGNNVLIFDHDHDFHAAGGLTAGAYCTGPVIIGKNVWIGASTVILRGTTIGDNCVVGAGSVLKGSFAANQKIVQKRETLISHI